MVDDVELRERLRSRLWEALDFRDPNWAEVERRLGRSVGWAFNQRRRKNLDIVDFWLLCCEVGVDPMELLRETLPAPEKDLSPRVKRALKAARARE